MDGPFASFVLRQHAWTALPACSVRAGMDAFPSPGSIERVDHKSARVFSSVRIFMSKPNTRQWLSRVFFINIKRSQRFNLILHTCEGLVPDFLLSQRQAWLISAQQQPAQCWEIGASPVSKHMS